jgi:hypothetical protein
MIWKRIERARMENNGKNPVELSDIFLRFGESYREGHILCEAQLKAYEAIRDCRTSALGCHSTVCDQCGHEQISYNSCRNRHCPKCQYLKQAMWVDKLQNKLLPVRYFHIVFTVPEFLKGLFYINQKACYDMLFKASSEAVKKAAANPSFLGAESGCLSVLHTWGQAMNYHPHIHALVPAGGLDPDGMEWINANKKFFVPVKALSNIYRAVFMRLLEKQLDKGLLVVPEKDKGLFGDLKLLGAKARSGIWHVYIKKAFRGAGQVVSYLGRYTHRVAISNSRILSATAEGVSFKWKDYRDKGQKVMTLRPHIFLWRFLQHILPTGFYKIRYYGIMGSANATTKMAQCFALIGASAGIPSYEGLSMMEVAGLVMGKDFSVCPVCKKGRMVMPQAGCGIDGFG